MKKIIKRIISLVIVLTMIFTAFVFSFPASASAGFALAQIFSDSAVLQRRQDLRVFGTAPTGTEVTVSITGGEPAINISETSSADESGKWIVTFPAQEAGRGYTLTATSNIETDTATDIAIGEVWLACGQSNMNTGLAQFMDEDSYMMMSDFDIPDIRRSTGSSWEKARTCTEAGGFPWSIVATHFAKELHDELDVPIGFIQNAVHGVSIHTYLTTGMLDIEPALEHYVPRPNWPVSQGSLFEVFRPMLPYSVKGMIWYQGESDLYLDNYDEYVKRLVDCYREEFQCPDMAFIQTQLTQYLKGDSNLWPFQRERQERANAAMVNAGLAPTIDIYEGSSIHPSNKGIVSERMAGLAMKICYGATDTYPESPTYDSHTVSGDTVTVKFKNVGKGLTVSGDYAAAAPTPYGFQLAGENGVYYMATSTKLVDKDKIEVKCTEVPNPLYIRYNFFPAPVCNLFTVDGIPASPFRTDVSPLSINDDGYASYIRLPDPLPVKGASEEQTEIQPLIYNILSESNAQDNVTEGDISLYPDKSNNLLLTFDIDVPEGSTVNRAVLRLCDRDTGESNNGTLSLGVYKIGAYNPENVNWDRQPAQPGDLIGGYYTPGMIHNDSNIDIELSPTEIESGKLYLRVKTLGYTYKSLGFLLDGVSLFVNTVKTPTEVKLGSPALRSEYLEGETFDSEGVTLSVKYADGTEEVTDDFVVEDKVFTAQDTFANVIFGGVKVQVPVTVTGETAEFVKFLVSPSKTKYIKGEPLLLKGAVIKTTAEDGSVKYLGAAEALVSGYEPDTVGKQTLTLTLGGKTLSFDVEVSEIPEILPYALLGDADGDSKITIMDSLSVFKIIAGKTAAPEDWTIEFTATDSNKDSKISIIDALAIFKTISGKEQLN